MDTNNPKTMKRRTFLNKTAQGIAFGLAAPTLLPSCARQASNQIMVAHIGVGGMGMDVLQNWLMPVTGAYNIATCDTWQKRRESATNYINNTYKEQGIKAPKSIPYLHFEEILERSDIDAVAITTPDHWHVPLAIKAARAGKHILLAKPLGLSYPNFKILEQEVKANGVKFHYGTQQRAMNHMKVAIGLIKDGALGQIERVEAWAPGKNPVESPQCVEAPVPEDFDFDKWTGPAPLNTYCPERVTNNASWFQWDYSIGFMAGWGAHPLDIMIWALKDQMDGEYNCEGTGTFWEPGGIYNNIYSWDVNYEYKSGIKLRFMSTDIVEQQNVWHYRTNKENNNTTFFGSKGWISVGRFTAESNVPEISKKFKEFPRDQNGRIIYDANRIGQEFIDVIKGNIPETNPLDEAILSDCVSHMGNIAIRTGQKISWNPVLGEVVNNDQANSWFVRAMREPYTV